jgi:hypothetical protein
VKLRNLYLESSGAWGEEGLLPEGSIGNTYGEFGPRQYEQNLLNFVDIVRNMGALPVLSTEATLVLNPDPRMRDRISYEYQLLDQSGLERAYRETYDIARRVAVAKGVSLLDAGAMLNDHAEYFADHVHLTPAGSEALARLTADHLAEIVATSNNRP